jgi:hypothetical protein
VLVVEVRARHAVGIALERHRAALEVREQRRRDPRVVVEHVRLGESGLGIQDLAQVRQPQPPAVDLDLGLLTLAHDLGGRHVLPQALVRGMPEHARGGPASELDLGDEDRLGEDRVRDRLAARERRLVAGQGPQPPPQLGAIRIAVADPDLAGVAQAAVLVAMADQQRAEPIGAAHVAAQPAADHELLALRVLDLDPRAAAPPRLVAAVEAFGHDPLESLRPGGGE